MTRRRLDTLLPSVMVAALLSLVALGGFEASGSNQPPGSPTPAPGQVATPAPRAEPISRPLALGPEQLVAHGMARPEQPSLQPDYHSLLVSDHCVDRDLPAPSVSDEIFTILDRSYALPSDHVPPDLVPAVRAGFGGEQGSKLVRAVLIDDLAAMREAWQAGGLRVEIQSAYRSYPNQAATFHHWVATYGREGALIRSARPGHSEHQLGTAVDFTSPGWLGRVGDWGVETAEGAWMAENAWRFGFVMSYPRGSMSQTCFSYEPWHYRWIGRAAAAEWMESGLPLRTFLERYLVAD
jgi:zinc D-Ala-D-Ala carboxypeptidase